MTEDGAAVTPSRTRTSVAAWILGFVMSLAGDQIFVLAMTWAAIQTRSAVAVAVVVASAAVSKLFLLLGGAVADRLSPLRSMLLADAGRTVVMVLAACLVASHHASVPVLVVLSLVAGALDGFFQPAVINLPERLIPDVPQTRISAGRTLVRRFALIIGGVAAGLIVAWAGPAGGFVAAAVCFGLSVISVPLIRPVKPAEDVRRPNLFREIGSGFRALRAAPAVMMVLLLLFLLNLGWAGPVTAGIPVVAAQRSWGPQGAGFVFAAFAAGAIVAAVLLYFRPTRRPVLWMLVGIAAMGVLIGVIGVTGQLTVVLVVAVVMGMASGGSGTCSNALVVSNMPDDHSGRAQAFYELVLELANPLSLAAAGYFAARGAAPVTFVVGGLIALVGVGIAASSRRVRRMQA